MKKKPGKMPMKKKDMGKDMPPWMRKDMPMMREEEKDKKPARKRPGKGKK